jgi:hypothetical protein
MNALLAALLAAGSGTVVTSGPVPAASICVTVGPYYLTVVPLTIGPYQVCVPLASGGAGAMPTAQPQPA